MRSERQVEARWYRDLNVRIKVRTMEGPAEMAEGNQVSGPEANESQIQ